MVNFYVATLFPEQVSTYLNTSITGRGIAKGAISLECIQMRDFAPNNYGRIDDTIYGGGTGMMIRPEPVYGAYEKACELCGGKKPHTVYMSPKGKVFDEAKAHELAKYDDILIVCGHYEGIDARVIDEICDEEISIGDYVLTGGELPALVLTDAVARMCENVLPSPDAYEEESHFNGLLEYPQYTRPEIWEGEAVPPVLLTGHHKNIAAWRQEESIRITKERRPDLWANWSKDK